MTIEDVVKGLIAIQQAADYTKLDYNAIQTYENLYAEQASVKYLMFEDYDTYCVLLKKKWDYCLQAVADDAEEKIHETRNKSMEHRQELYD